MAGETNTGELCGPPGAPLEDRTDRHRSGAWHIEGQSHVPKPLSPFFSLHTVPSDHKRENSGPTLEMERRLELYGVNPMFPALIPGGTARREACLIPCSQALVELLGTRKEHPLFPKSGLCIQRKG